MINSGENHFCKLIMVIEHSDKSITVEVSKGYLLDMEEDNGNKNRASLTSWKNRICNTSFCNDNGQMSKSKQKIIERYKCKLTIHQYNAGPISEKIYLM